MKVSRRRKLLVGLLVVLLVVLFTQRNRWATLPNAMARRQLAVRRDAGDAAAEAWLQTSLRLSPRNAETQWLLARVARRQGRMSAVKEHLTLAQEYGLARERIEREQWLALAQDGQMRAAEPHLSELLLKPDGDEQEILNAYVIGYLKAQSLGKAKQLLDAWAKDFPNTAEPHFLRGVIEQDATSWGPAIEHFQTALAADPKHPRAALHLAHCLLSMKRHQEALTYFERASQLPAAEREAKVGMAQCLTDLGRNEEARTLLQDVLIQEPQHMEATLELARLEVDNAEYDQALERLQRLYQRRPRDYDVRFTLATALRGLGRAEEAKEHFEVVSLARSALRRASTLADGTGQDLETRYQIGLIYLEYGDPKQGVLWLRSVLDENPDHTPTHIALAEYYDSKADESSEFQELAAFHREKADS